MSEKIISGFKSREVSLSIGFSTASEYEDIKSMIYIADSKMYQHKFDLRDNAIRIIILNKKIKWQKKISAKKEYL